jgi:hypothetical protein
MTPSLVPRVTLRVPEEADASLGLSVDSFERHIAHGRERAGK